MSERSIPIFWVNIIARFALVVLEITTTVFSYIACYSFTDATGCWPPNHQNTSRFLLLLLVRILTLNPSSLRIHAVNDSRSCELTAEQLVLQLVGWGGALFIWRRAVKEKIPPSITDGLGYGAADALCLILASISAVYLKWPCRVVTVTCDPASGDWFSPASVECGATVSPSDDGQIRSGVDIGNGKYEVVVRLSVALAILMGVVFAGNLSLTLFEIDEQKWKPDWSAEKVTAWWRREMKL